MKYSRKRALEYPSEPSSNLHLYARSGFTLIEMLVVIAIIALLTSILVPTVSTALLRASSVRSMNNLRQTYQGMVLYAMDHNEYLPGPLWSQILPIRKISSGEADSAQVLPSYLVPYLDAQEIEENTFYFPMFDYPAWRRKRRGENAPSYYIQRILTVDGRNYYPLGYNNTNSDSAVGQTMKLTHLGSLNGFDQIWIIEADAEYLPNKGYTSALPEVPVHGRKRNALMYGGNVSSIPVD